MLGDSGSIFVQSLARRWADAGLHVDVVSREQQPEPFDDRISVHSCHQWRPSWTKPLRIINPLLRWLERKWPEWTIRRYRQVTGRDRPEEWGYFWVDAFWDAFSCAAAVDKLKPDFVFGQEAAAYGYATARCRNVPRILFPWGGDIFLNVEASPFVRRLVRKAVSSCELLVPSAHQAAERLKELGAPADRIRPISWGAKLADFQREECADRRTELLRGLNFPADAVVLMNCRRFLPLWGAQECVRAFIGIAERFPAAHFLLLGGVGVEATVARAKTDVAAAGLTERFHFVDGNISLQRCAELFSIADISLSLLGHGDMRSSSVLQAAAAGGIPVLAESPEYRQMAADGFAARFVDKDNVADIEATLTNLLDHSNHFAEIRTNNARYLQEHEDADRQMERLLDEIEQTVTRWRASEE